MLNFREFIGQSTVEERHLLINEIFLFELTDISSLFNFHGELSATARRAFLDDLSESASMRDFTNEFVFLGCILIIDSIIIQFILELIFASLGSKV